MNEAMKRILLLLLTCIFTSFAFAQEEVDIEELKQLLHNIDIMIGNIYENSRGSKYSIVISSLYGINKTMNNDKGEICNVIFNEKLPLIFIDDFITKKDYLIEDEKFLLALDKVLFDKQICLLNKKCKLDYIRSVFYSTPKSIALTYLILCYLSKVIYSHMGELVDFT